MKSLNRIIAALILTTILSACGVSIEQPSGTRLVPDLQPTGEWDTTIALKGAERGRLTVNPAGDALLVRWSEINGKGGSSTASLFELHGMRYLALTHDPQKDGYFIVRIETISRDQVRVRALNPARTEQLLKEMALPATYRDRWLHRELFLDKATFLAVAERHSNALFADGVLIALDRVR